MWTRKELKKTAKFRFKATYWKTVLVSLVIMLLVGGMNIGFSLPGGQFGSSYNMDGTSDYYTGEVYQSSSVDSARLATVIGVGIVIFLVIFLIILAISIVISAFIINPVVVGCSRYFVSNLKDDTEVKTVFSGFDSNYKNGVKIMFLRDLFTFFWSLLFVIPGIVKTYEYRMIPYLLAEHPGMSKDMAFAVSRQMMSGNKWRAFVLDLSFILWHILSLFTCGILEIFYVAPYVNMTNAAFYATLKNMNLQGQGDSIQIENSISGSIE